MPANLTTFSFPLRSLEPASVASSAYLLRRFHGDGENLLVRRWCDEGFMTTRNSPWPLVLYGPSGTGKSALAETLACRTGLSCIRLTVDEVRRRFLAAAATRTIATFQKKMRAGELLLLDELTLQAGETPLVRELVQLIDDYGKNQRPVIITMRQMPGLRGALPDSLRSRLSEGLVVEVKRPGLAARREIAAEMIRHFGLKILDEDLDWLSRSLPETVASDSKLSVPDRAASQ